jgi:hypothetical protein
MSDPASVRNKRPQPDSIAAAEAYDTALSYTLKREGDDAADVRYRSSSLA